MEEKSKKRRLVLFLTEAFIAIGTAYAAFQLGLKTFLLGPELALSLGVMVEQVIMCVATARAYERKHGTNALARQYIYTAIYCVIQMFLCAWGISAPKTDLYVGMECLVLVLYAVALWHNGHATPDKEI